VNQNHIHTAADLPTLPWLEVVNPPARLGRVRHALFDFDGTISVIRQGWENIMIPLMVEMICDAHPPTPEIESEVAEYVDHSTGILTIKQMQWLEEAVHRYGLARAPKSAREYKRIYNERLLRPVRQRLSQMDGSRDPGEGQRAEGRDRLMIAGARDFLQALYERGVTLYLASGTDHVYVLQEATALDVQGFFGEHIYGARDDTEAFTKERIIQRILDDHRLRGEELLVVGDGPVEIRHAKARGALALGVAADEEQRQGLSPRKRQRLLAAGADLIVTDLTHYDELVNYLC
jgi:phosphoglycolate phosphatase